MKHFFFADIRTKVLALIFALLIWSIIRVQFVDEEVTATAISGEHIYTQVPISIMQQPSDKNVYELDPSEATVTLTGNRNILKNTGKEAIVLYVTVDSEDVGKNENQPSANIITITKKVQCKIPSDVTMKDIDPKVVRINYRTSAPTTDKPEESSELASEISASEKEPQ